MRRGLVVLADRPQSRAPWLGLAACLERLGATTRWRPGFVVWDGADLPRSLSRLGPVREVETMNRWRLPQWLEHLGLRFLMRAARHGRMRWWWLRMRRCEAALLVGPLRREMWHYLPPGDYPKIAYIEPRLGGVTGTEDQTGGPGSVEPAETIEERLVAHPFLTDARRPERRRALEQLGLPSTSLVIGSWGPSGDRPLEGVDRLVRTLWSVVDLRPDLDVHAVWAGADPTDLAYFPVAHALRRLGLDDRFRTVPEQDLGPDLATLFDVLVLTARGPTRSWPLGELRELGVTVVRFDHVSAEGGEHDRLSPYLDVDGLALEVGAALDEHRSRQEAAQLVVGRLAKALG